MRRLAVCGAVIPKLPSHGCGILRTFAGGGVVSHVIDATKGTPATAVVRDVSHDKGA